MAWGRCGCADEGEDFHAPLLERHHVIELVDSVGCFGCGDEGEEWYGLLLERHHVVELVDSVGAFRVC